MGGYECEVVTVWLVVLGIVCVCVWGGGHRIYASPIYKYNNESTGLQV